VLLLDGTCACSGLIEWRHMSALVFHTGQEIPRWSQWRAWNLYLEKTITCADSRFVFSLAYKACYSLEWSYLWSILLNFLCLWYLTAPKQAEDFGNGKFLDSNISILATVCLNLVYESSKFSYYWHLKRINGKLSKYSHRLHFLENLMHWMN
jgi:hypothetical protein